MSPRAYPRLALVAGIGTVICLFAGDAWRLPAAIALAVLLLLIVNFYRDPERTPPVRPGVFVVSPADGRVVRIERTGDRLELSIFLSAFDVHVNRAPASGRIVGMSHVPGRYLPAFMGRAQSQNERVVLTLESDEAGRILCTQVAGLLARRIENWAETGQSVRQGERYGMIHLGSRVDVELEGRFEPLVRRGQHVRAGQTPLAEVPGG